jgi:hypothetical protein
MIHEEKFIRMDRDVAIGASGIPDGYTFQQSFTKIVVTIDRDRPFPDMSLDQAFDPTENSIFIAPRIFFGGHPTRYNNGDFYESKRRGLAAHRG